MKRFTKIFYLLIVMLTLFSCNTDNKKLQADIDNIVNNWVTDKREGVFEVDIKKVRRNSIVLAGETNIAEARDYLINFLKTKGYKVSNEIKLLPDSTVGNKKHALINISVAQMRSKPKNASELVSQVLLGTPVKVLKLNKDWALIQTPDNYIAWIKRLSLSFLSIEEFNNWKQSKREIFIGQYGRLYDKNDNMVSDLVAGCIMQKVGENNEKTQIKLPNGNTGYIESKFVRDFTEWRSDTVFSADELISEAKMLIGIPYLWGGASIKAMDCSGFIKTIFFNHGIITSRDASQQVLYGDSVSIADNYKHLRKGDLLFFESPTSGNITHVAMYIGDKEYIQAAGCVKINSLDSTKHNFSAFRIPTLKYARRYVGKSSQKGICFTKNHSWY